MADERDRPWFSEKTWKRKNGARSWKNILRALPRVKCVSDV